jgi:hypothetical protein
LTICISLPTGPPLTLQWAHTEALLRLLTGYPSPWSDYGDENLGFLQSMVLLRAKERRARLKYSKWGHVPICIGDDPLDPVKKIIVNLKLGPDRRKKMAMTGM